MPVISKALRQAYELQDFTYNCLEAMKTQLTDKDGNLKLSRDDAQAIANLTKSWIGCQERVAFHRRVPSPGTLRPEPKPKKPTLRVWSKVQAIEHEQPAIEVPPQPQLPAPEPLKPEPCEL